MRLERIDRGSVEGKKLVEMSQPLVGDLRAYFDWTCLPNDINQIIQAYAWGRLVFVTEWKSSAGQKEEEITISNPILKRYSYDTVIKMLKTLGDADCAIMSTDLDKACFLLRAEFQYHDKWAKVAFADGKWASEEVFEWANIYTYFYKQKGQEHQEDEHQALVNDLICAFAKRFLWTQPCKEDTWFTLKYQAERWRYSLQASEWQVFESSAPETLTSFEMEDENE
jgi:hypothetical protein